MENTRIQQRKKGQGILPEQQVLLDLSLALYTDNNFGCNIIGRTFANCNISVFHPCIDLYMGSIVLGVMKLEIGARNIFVLHASVSGRAREGLPLNRLISAMQMTQIDTQDT